MANYPQGSYDAANTELFSTDEYGGSDSDVTSIEQFSINIDLTAKTSVTMNCKFVEIGGAPGTDSLIINIYRNLTNTWDGDEIRIKQVEIPNDGSEDIKSLVIDALASGFGNYRLGIASEGGTNTFDVDIQARYSRFQIATS